LRLKEILVLDLELLKKTPLGVYHKYSFDLGATPLGSLRPADRIPDFGASGNVVMRTQETLLTGG
jgi:hypothetical protein